MQAYSEALTNQSYNEKINTKPGHDGISYTGTAVNNTTLLDLIADERMLEDLNF